MLVRRDNFARTFAVLFGPQTKPDAQEMEQFWRLLEHAGGHHLVHKLIHYIPERRANRARWVGALQRTRVPLRVIDGPEDPVSGGHMVERYRELVPSPDTVLLPGIGHYPQVEAPQATWRAFAEFQARVGAITA
jgi:pimeloyl-ACP methyl ester carboxylesterase